MKPRRNRILGQDPSAPSSARMSNEHHGCNSNCLQHQWSETVAVVPHKSPRRTAHPEYLPRHDVYRLLCYVPSRRNRNGRAQSGTYAEFDSGCTVKLVDPVRNLISMRLSVVAREPYLFVDVLQRSVGMLAVTNTMTSHTCLTGIFFALDQHLDVVGGC